MTKVYTGGCLCGFIRISARSPRNLHTCSCTLCQKHTGAHSVGWVEFDAQDVQWTGKGGKPATWRSSEFSSRAFCPCCGSSIGAIDDAPTVALLTGCFDEAVDTEFTSADNAGRGCV